MDNDKLIRAGALVEVLRDDLEINGKNFARVKEHIDRADAVEAAPVVHGEWIGTQYDGYADGNPVYDLWECSECREEFEYEGDPPPFAYCPYCGVKMDGERGAGE